MQINRFMGAHLDQMARNNRFEVRLHGPPGSGINNRGMRCTAVSVPNKTIETEAHNYGGGTPDRKYAKKVIYENEITLTFLLDHTYEDRQQVEMWMSTIHDEAYNLNYPESYHGSIEITQLGVDNIPVYEVKCHEAFPTSLGNLAFGMEEAGIQTMEVTFTFRTWSSSFENSPTGLLGGLFNKYSRKLQSKIGKKINDKLFG